MDQYKFLSSTCLGIVNMGFISLLLYPLERVQTIKQIQNTYSKSTLKQLNNVFTQCTHYGVRASFRGFKSNLIKLSIVYSAFQFWSKFKLLDDIAPAKIIKFIVLMTGYTMAYPLQTIKTRMGADIEQDRFYSNMRECIRKMKKNEGALSFYRGYLIGITQFSAQIGLIASFFKYRQQTLKQVTYVQGLQLFAAFLGFQIINYPIDTIKKQKQINGSLGHSNQFGKLSQIFKQNKFSEIYKGFPIRLSNSLLYTTLILYMGQRIRVRIH